MDGQTDMELVRQYAATGSDDVFAEIVRRRVNLVYSVAMRRLGDAHLAEEVTQAVFIILARKAGSLKPGTILSGWLYQTAQLTAANHQRSVLRRQRREQEAAMQFVHESEPDESWKRLQPLLEDAMTALGAKERDAVVLRFFENRTVADVAAQLQVNEAAAQKRVTRATEKLRKFFSRRGVQISAGVLVTAIGTNSIQAAPASMAASVAGAAALKGAAASVSTLTLIQGTLKIMAWTKLKTSLVVGAIALFAVGTAVVSVQAVKYVRISRYPNLTGAWEGTLDVSGAKLRLVLKMVKTNGAYRASIDSIDQSAKDLGVANIAYDYPKLNLEVTSIGGTIEGKVDPGATELTGKWKQMNTTWPLTLKRTTTPDIIQEPLTASDCPRRKDSDLQGIWESSVALNGQQIPVELRISEPTSGTYRAEISSSAGIGRVPVSELTYTKPSVSIEFAGASSSFNGTVDADDQQMSGTYHMGEASSPVKFKRTDSLAKEQREMDKDYSHSSPNDLQGHWAGALSVQGTKLHLKVDIAKLPDGNYDCSLTSVDQGNAVIGATSIKFTSPKVNIKWDGIMSAFNGEIKNGKLPGKWTQGGAIFPLALERTGK